MINNDTTTSTNSEADLNSRRNPNDFPLTRPIQKTPSPPPPPPPPPPPHSSSSQHHSIAQKAVVRSARAMTVTNGNSSVSSDITRKKPKSSVSDTERHRLPVGRSDYTSDSNIEDSQPLQNRFFSPQGHTRTDSRDSNNSLGSYTEDQRERIERKGSAVDAYFQRLARLPLIPHLPQDVMRVAEACRSILFIISQVHTSSRQCIMFSGNERLEKLFSRLSVESTGTTHQLVVTLEKFDAVATQQIPDNAITHELLNICVTSLNSFRRLVSFINSNLKTITQLCNVRFTRGLLIQLHSSIVEIKFAWDIIAPLIQSSAMTPTAASTVASHPSSYFPAPSNNISGQQFSPSSPAVLSVPSTPHTSTSTGTRNPLPKPVPVRSHTAPAIDSPHLPMSPLLPSLGSSEAENDRQLLSCLSIATNTSENVTALLQGAIESGLVSLEASEERGDKAGLITGLKDLLKQVNTVREVTKRLQRSLNGATTARDVDPNVGRRLLEDVNAFMKAILSMMNLIRTLLPFNTFPKQVASLLHQLTKSTKEVHILWPVSSFVEEGQLSQSTLSAPNSGSAAHSRKNSAPQTPGFPLPSSLGLHVNTGSPLTFPPGSPALTSPITGDERAGLHSRKSSAASSTAASINTATGSLPPQTPLTSSFSSPSSSISHVSDRLISPIPPVSERPRKNSSAANQEKRMGFNERFS